MAPLVEARRDGRVGERESASLDRHLLTCASCRALASDLERLASLAASGRIAPLSPLEQRRGRLRLLRDAAFTPIAAGGTRARSRLQIVRLAAVAAMILGVLAGGTALAVLGLPSAKPGPREAEPIPSAATVSAPIGRGAKLESIEAPTVAPPEVPASAAPHALAPKEAAAAAPITPAPRLTGPRPKRESAAPATSALAASQPGEGASALAAGVELIERGDYGAAAERLRSFRQSHPTDARAEDAAFLAVLALERAGHHAAAVAAAREYLAIYPKGYRRAEAQSISTAP